MMTWVIRLLGSRLVKFGIGPVLALAGAFALGWKASGWVLGQKLTKAQASVMEARLESERVLSDCRAQAAARERAVREQLQTLEARRRGLERRYAALQAVAQRQKLNLQKEIDDAREEGRRAGRAACQLTRRWVWLYNRALCPTGTCSDQGEAPRVPFVAPTGAGAVESAGVTEWDALKVHAENAARWKKCRDQLNALIDWSEGGERDKR